MHNGQVVYNSKYGTGEVVSTSSDESGGEIHYVKFESIPFLRQYNESGMPTDGNHDFDFECDPHKITLNKHDLVYHNHVHNILHNGRSKGDRTKTGTLSVFGTQLRFDLSDGTIPLLTTKQLHVKSIIHELLWFLSGSTNTKYLVDNGVRIWNEWADENGDLGPLYGKQFRDRNGVDQIKKLINDLKTTPDSRRHVVDLWDIDVLPDETISPQENVANGKMALAPCHMMTQWYVIDGQLSCMLYMRSSDTTLGLGFNIAQYGILLQMIAQVCGLGIDELIVSIGDAHIYSNHMDQIKLQMSRSSKSEPPSLFLNPDIMNIDDFAFDDIMVVGYDAHEKISAVVAV